MWVVIIIVCLILLVFIGGAMLGVLIANYFMKKED